MTPDEGRRIACLLVRRGRFLVGEPFFEPGLPITLGRLGSAAAEPGDLVVTETTAGGRRARVVDRLGRPDDVGAVLAALAGEAGVARPFPPDVEQASAALPADPAPPHGGRRDLRGHLAFTVDPGTAKDHDDALSVLRGPDGVRVLVHIADVSAAVPPGGPLDREAERRGFSVYLPGRVEPMLPPALSAGLCSLVPGRPRDVVTVEIPFDDRLVPGRPAFYRAQIVSRRRFAYEEVQELLDGGGDADPALRQAVEDGDRVAAALREARRRRGAVALHRPEIEVRLGEGRVVDAAAVGEPRAHALVEELMIAANEAVAGLLTRARRRAIFRAHEPPDPEAVERLHAQLADLGVPTPPLAETLSPAEASAAIGRVSSAVAAYARSRRRGGEAWSTLVLRAMQKARYDADLRRHAGLASPAYCHFTSPIRRFPDLVVHRALLAQLGLAPDPPPDDLAGLAEVLSATERAAADLERRGVNLCLAWLLQDRLDPERDEVFAGEVVGLIGAGLFVRFDGVFEGFLPARQLRRDYYDVSPLGTALVGRASGRRYRLGDALAVRVERIEAVRGRVALTLARPDELDGEAA